MNRAVKRTNEGWFSAFAPASVANFGSGFDAFAAAIGVVERGKSKRETIRPFGDVVRVRRSKAPGVRVLAIQGDGGRLPASSAKNCAAVAAAALLRAYRASFGLELVLEKGLPLSSGVGSSAASAAAGAAAAALALSGDIDTSTPELVHSALLGEHEADGSWHGDNVWASLFGGGVLVLSTRPPELVALGGDSRLRLIVVHPHVELPTRRARAALPKRIAIGDATAQAARFAELALGWESGDRETIGRGLTDRIAEPPRARLVPGFAEAKKAALRAGAFGMTFAGAGPSVLAIGPSGSEESIAKAVARAFRRVGVDSDALVCAVDLIGARAV